MIDLHLHTTYSDGKMQLKDILKLASQNQLDVISITDHDTVDAYQELKNHFLYRDLYKGKIIKGTELALRYDGTDVHFLVYDYDFEKMKKFISQHFKTKYQINKYSAYELIKKCYKAGLILNEENINIDYKKEFPVYKIYKEIMSHEGNSSILPAEVWGDCSAFIYKYLKVPGSPYYVDLSDFVPAFADVSDELKENCGGKIFLAHPFNYKDRSQTILDGVVKTGLLDGIECNHSNLNGSQSLYLQEYCKRKKLLMSGGSDYHAKNEPIYIGLGTDDKPISFDLIKDWVDKGDNTLNEKNFGRNK